jgi:O-methyltransferase
MRRFRKERRQSSLFGYRNIDGIKRIEQASMIKPPSELYLELMKKTLSLTLWPEPSREIKPLGTHSLVNRKVISFVTGLLRKRNFVISQRTAAIEADRETGNFWPGYAHTMVGVKRLDNIQQCIEIVLRNQVEGDFIETGVWRGGTCIFMRSILAAYGVSDRRVFVADSFEGLPKPSPEKYPADKGDIHHLFYSNLAVPKQEVETNFRNYGLLDDQVVFLKGWFKDTLPSAPIEKLAILRLDGDMYESTMDALVPLYPKLSKGGFCIVDDYALDGCRKAVDDYRKEHAIESRLQPIDWTGHFWIKE